MMFLLELYCLIIQYVLHHSSGRLCTLGRIPTVRYILVWTRFYMAGPSFYCLLVFNAQVHLFVLTLFQSVNLPSQADLFNCCIFVSTHVGAVGVLLIIQAYCALSHSSSPPAPQQEVLANSLGPLDSKLESLTPFVAVGRTFSSAPFSRPRLLSLGSFLFSLVVFSPLRFELLVLCGLVHDHGAECGCLPHNLRQCYCLCAPCVILFGPKSVCWCICLCSASGSTFGPCRQGLCSPLWAGILLGLRSGNGLLRQPFWGLG